MTGTLYLVGTPIGNLGDITKRAADTLSAADFIAAEDTRVTMKLLSSLGIKKELVSYYEHNKRESGKRILARLLSGESCALVTDAGMPAISDPGETLAAMCHENGVAVRVVPGPCAAVCAVALSGLPTGRFTFEGFLSVNKRSRYEHLDSLRNETRTMVFYEAPHKLLATLRDMLDIFGDRRISISRELTKIHEQTITTTLADALAYYETREPKGEYVLVIEGRGEGAEPEYTLEDAVNIALSLKSESMRLNDAVRRSSQKTGIAKNLIYDEAVKRLSGTDAEQRGAFTP